MTIEPDYVSPCGSVTLYRGDCLEVMPRLDCVVDCICTDLPFGTTACKWDSVIPFPVLWASYTRLIKSNGAVVLFGIEPFSSRLRTSNERDYRYDWIWEKPKATSFLLAKKKPLTAHECISVFCSGQPLYIPQMLQGKPYDRGLVKDRIMDSLTDPILRGTHVRNESGLRYPRSVLKFRTAESEGKFHPTQKPVALIEYLIRTYTNESETVLDSTFGSGTTAIACLNTNRCFVGIERDPVYFAAAVARIEAHIAKRAEQLFTLEAA